MRAFLRGAPRRGFLPSVADARPDRVDAGAAVQERRALHRAGSVHTDRPVLCGRPPDLRDSRHSRGILIMAHACATTDGAPDRGIRPLARVALIGNPNTGKT